MKVIFYTRSCGFCRGKIGIQCVGNSLKILGFQHDEYQIRIHYLRSE